MKRMAFWLGLSAVVIVLDQITKWMILGAFVEGERLQVIEDVFYLVLAFNPGAAFSILADHSGWQRWFFTVLAILICSWLSRLMWQSRHTVLEPLAFALVIGGAIGNVIDRFIHGKVVDFLLVYLGDYPWPAFNLADSAICLGVTLMIIAQVREARRQKREEKA